MHQTMSRRVRLYAEAIEQAYHYLLPAIQETLSEIEIEIVYAPSRLQSSHENQTLQALYQATTPDGLISIIDNDIETPLAVIEFSESVMTEDHEYQRTPGVFLCAALDLVYIKVAGHKQTVHGMGGNTRFNPLSVGSAFIQRADYFGFLMCKWETIPGDPTKLWRDDKYPSIPHRDACPLYLETIKLVINTAFIEGILPGNRFTESVWEQLRGVPVGEAYIHDINFSPDTDSLNHSWRNATLNLGYRRWHAENGAMTVWIYRWGHGMDPDRGCLQFVGSFCNEDHVIARYTGLRRSPERRIDTEDVHDTESLRQRFLKVCKLDKGLDRKMIEQIQNAPIIDGQIDLTDWLCRDGIYEKLNKPATTLVTFADELLIHDVPDHSCQLKVVWDREFVLRGEVSQDLSHIKRVVDRFHGNSPLPVGPSGTTEDPVTFCFVHDVAPTMGWTVHSASYPGAQGGVVILPAGYGRQRKRIYCDGVASIDRKGILFEAKDTEAKSISGEDPEKLHYLVSDEMDGVRDAFNGVGVSLDSTPLTVVGFYSQSHAFDVDRFTLVDVVLSIDPNDNSWILYSVTERRELASGRCSAPQMLAVR
jgi:hypothetical protein